MKARQLWLATLRVAGTLLVAFGAAGCRAGFPEEELPDDPIAFMRQEAEQGIAGLEDFRDALRIPNPADPKTMQPRRTATLSLLNVKTRKVSAVPGAGQGAFPLDWSPDGIQLLIGRYDRAAQAFRLIAWNRHTGAVSEVRPTLSMGGAALGRGPIRLAHIARLPQANGQWGIGIRLNLERQGLTPLPGGVPGHEPDVSPDSRTVVFERPSANLQTDATLLLFRLGEQAPRVLGRGRTPRFSRDGQWITFVRTRRGQLDVWLMRSDGTGKRALTDTTFDEEFPAVSPQGRYVVFASVRPPSDQTQLYMVRVRDKRVVQLTQSGQNSRPLW